MFGILEREKWARPVTVCAKKRTNGNEVVSSSNFRVPPTFIPDFHGPRDVSCTRFRRLGINTPRPRYF